MSLPILHSYAGYAIYKLVKKRLTTDHRPQTTDPFKTNLVTRDSLDGPEPVSEGQRPKTIDQNSLVIGLRPACRTGRSFVFGPRFWDLSPRSSVFGLGSLVLAIIAANLPDLDFLPGFMRGNPHLYHHGVSHSLFAGAVVGLLTAGVVLIAAVLRPKTTDQRPQTKDLKVFGPPAGRAGLWSFVFSLTTFSYWSHLLLDYISGPGIGVPLFWPFSSNFYYFPWHLSVPGDGSFYDMTSFKDLFVWFFAPRTMRLIFYEFTVAFSIWAVVTMMHELRRGIAWRASQSLILGAHAVVFLICFFMTQLPGFMR